MSSARRYLDHLSAALASLDLDQVQEVANELGRVFAEGRTVYCIGNGGSAATASHLAADLPKLTAAPLDGPRLRAMSLCEHVPAISAIGNDIAYADVFVEQLRTFLRPGDLVIGFTTSGTSPNVVRALEYATTSGAATVAVTGRLGTGLRHIVDICLVVDSDRVQQTEDASMVAAHLMCVLARERCDALRAAAVVPVRA